MLTRSHSFNLLFLLVVFSVLGVSCAPADESGIQHLKDFLQDAAFRSVQVIRVRQQQALPDRGAADGGPFDVTKQKHWCLTGSVPNQESHERLARFLYEKRLLDRVGFEVIVGRAGEDAPRVDPIAAQKLPMTIPVGRSVGHSSFIHGERYVFQITSEDLSGMKDYFPADPVPLPTQEAVSKATKASRQYLAEEERQAWRITNVMLRRFGASDKWYYIVTFSPKARVITGGPMEQLTIPVLFDGRVVPGRHAERPSVPE